MIGVKKLMPWQEDAQADMRGYLDYIVNESKKLIKEIEKFMPLFNPLPPERSFDELYGSLETAVEYLEATSKFLEESDIGEQVGYEYYV